MSGPGKFKDHNKSAKDVSIGSVDSYKVKLTNNAADGTKVETSQETKHANSGSALTKLALKFNKSNGLRLESFEASSDGALKGSVGFGGLAPGVEVSAGAERSVKEGNFTNSVYLSGTYKHKMAVVDGKIDVLAKSLGVNALAQYQNVLVGGTAGFSQATPLTNCGLVLGYGCNNGNRVTVTMDKKKNFTLNSYFKPKSGIEVSFLGNGAITTVDASAEDGASSKEGETKKQTTKVSFEATMAAAYALDNNGTSLTASLSTNAMDYMNKLNVGVSYTQKVRSWAELTISGEVGVTNSEHVAFGAEINVGDL